MSFLLRALPVAILFFFGLYFCLPLIPATRTDLVTQEGLLSALGRGHDDDGGHQLGLDEIPSFGLGTWLSKRGKVAHAVKYALDNGYNHIDAALIYHNEDKVGDGIAASRSSRRDFWVTSKLWNYDHRPELVQKAARKTIADLGVNYLDLYLMHFPVAFVPGEGTTLDHETSILDTWRAMEDLVRKGYTRHIGISNFAQRDVEAVLDMCTICPYAHELETHPYLQQQSFVDWHLSEDINMKVIAYSPFANTNPVYDRGQELEYPLLQDPFWLDLAKSKNATVAQAVLAWGLQRGTVVIPKSIEEKHLAENLEATSKDIRFTEEEMAEIALQDKRARMNDPGKSWGVRLFADLDDPTVLEGDDEGAELK